MRKKQKVDVRVILVGLICITILECVAIFMGFNGTLLKLVMFVIGTTIGITLPVPKSLKTK